MKLKQVINPEKYTHMRVYYDASRKALWFKMAASPIPCFTPGLLNDINRLFEETAEYNLSSTYDPIKYIIVASGVKGVFNLGGNLELFVNCIKNKEQKTLELYTYNCIRAMLNSSQSFHTGTISISLVQGDALGGGFEAALSSNIIIAEEQAKFQFPESIFHLFPGMGAFDYLARIIGPFRALAFIQSSKTYSAEEMQNLQCIDKLVAKNEGIQAVHNVIDSRPYEDWLKITKNNYQCIPLDIDSVTEIAELWVEKAMQIDHRSIKIMERIIKRQKIHTWELIDPYAE